MTRPGARLRSWATRLLDPLTMERLIDPAIADLQHEHEEAVRRNLAWRGRWIQITSYVAFAKVFTVAASGAAGRALRDWARADDRAVGRTIGFSLATIAALAALLMWPTVSTFAHRVPADKVAWAVIYMLPSVLLIAIPLGLIFGILSGLRGRIATVRVRRSVAAMAIVCSIATLALAAWTMPAGNQAFRAFLAGRRLPANGFNEMTLGELARTPAQNKWIVSSSAARLAFEFHFRLALAFASLALGPFALAVTAAWRGAYRVRGGVLAGFLAGVAYWVLLNRARQYGYAADQQARVAVAWIPNLVFLAMTLLLFRWTRTAEAQESRQ
jgi:lipopolysaccharide export LptBFGC system permease protein LptF